MNRGYSFWNHIHPMFLSRDLTRHDLRELLHRGLTTTSGNYRALLRLFGMPDEDYKRFLNFLAAHQCNVDGRAYRGGASLPAKSARILALPPLTALSGGAPAAMPQDTEREEPSELV